MKKLLALGFLLSVMVPIVHAEDAATIKARVGKAAKGETVQLPAGTFALGDLLLPDGASLKGAGYKATIIDASGHDFGLIVNGKAPARISDLAVASAAQAGVRLDGASNVAVERVLVRNCGSGVLARNGSKIALRNLVLADNYAGVNLARITDSSLVNCTVAYSGSTALRIDACDRLAIFNNLFTYAATGISVNGANGQLAIDRNLCIANWVGRMAGEAARRKVEAWSALSGHDKHSLTIGVTYGNRDAGDLRPTSPLPWAPDRATTSDWGVAALGGAKAPRTDIDGKPRVGGVDLGAYEAGFGAPREPDGTFTVQSGSGVTSAGLFTQDDRCVRYLFQNLPLQKGAYRYWLPTRDWQGRPCRREVQAQDR